MSKSNKLAKLGKKWGGTKAIAKAAKKQGQKESGLGKTGHKIIQGLGQLGVGVITKNVGRVKLPLVGFSVAPDEAVTALGGIGMLALGGGKRKWAEDAFWSGLSAVFGRWTWTGQLVVIGDGKTVNVAQGMPETKPEPERDISVKAKVSQTDDGRTVVDGVEVTSRTKAA